MSLQEAARLRGLAKVDKDLRARERKEAKAQWERDEPMRNLLKNQQNEAKRIAKDEADRERNAKTAAKKVAETEKVANQLLVKNAKLADKAVKQALVNDRKALAELKKNADRELRPPKKQRLTIKCSMCNRVYDELNKCCYKKCRSYFCNQCNDSLVHHESICIHSAATSNWNVDTELDFGAVV